MYNEESSALRTWSWLASLRILLNLLNLCLILTVLPIRFEGLLNLLTLFASAFLASTFGCRCCCCWLTCFPCFLVCGGAFHFGDFFQASAGTSFCSTGPAWSSGLFLLCHQSLEQCRLRSEVGGTTCLWCPCAGDELDELGWTRCMGPSFWFVLWHWGRSFWILGGGTTMSTLYKSCLPSSPFLLLSWPVLVWMVIVPVW